jgi:hypothetical protein
VLCFGPKQKFRSFVLDLNQPEQNAISACKA